MGTFAETVNVDYFLLFADQGKRTFCFCLPQTNGSLLFTFLFVANKQNLLFSVSSFSVCKYILKRQHTYIYAAFSCDIYIYTENRTIYISSCFKGKTKTQAISLIRLPFAHHANESSSFVC
jgi:hypothetical protein